MDCYQHNNSMLPTKPTLSTPILHTNPTKDVDDDAKEEEEAEEDGTTEAEEVAEDGIKVVEEEQCFKID